MDTILCSKCGNATPKNQKVCLYCQTPLSRTDSPTKTKSKVNPRIFFLIALLIVGIKSLPNIVRFFRGDTKVASSVRKPAPTNPPIEEKEPTSEESALAAYKNLTKAIDNGDETTARRYISNAKWNELSLETDDPSAVEALNPSCPVETKFESHDMDDRAVLFATGKSTKVTDQDGKPASTALIVNMAKEDDQWKVFSFTCHYSPPPNYKKDAMAWLFEQASTFDDLNSKLVANGLHDGEVSCFMALKYRKTKPVRKCLETGWSVYAEDTDGRKAFDIALENIDFPSPQSTEMIELFVKEGANINQQNKEGMTPLMLAAIHCNDEVAKVFIDAGADVDYKTKDGITSSKLAENCPKVTKLLRAVKSQ